MHGESRTSTPRGEQPTGDLARLLEAEARFAELLAAAIAERDRCIEEARAAAGREQQIFLDGREAELAALDERIEQDMRLRLERIEAEARDLIAAWSKLRPADIESFADRIARRLIEPDGPAAAEHSVPARAERAR
jgi:hypothetical protein